MKLRAQNELSRRSARQFMSSGQYSLLAGLLLAAVVGLVFWTILTIMVLIDVTLLITALIVVFKVVMHFASLQDESSTRVSVDAADPALPTYTILVPLFKEANVLEALVDSINRLRYPLDKLQVLLLLEEDDHETQAAAGLADLTEQYQVIVAPAIPKGQERLHQPKGKPRALNVGLPYATGEFTVIFDAEDRPEPDQLLKAVTAFRASSRSVACMQARLQFWNEDTSSVTRFYWAEYVVHFNFVLKGLAKLSLVPPLGGTSNHFRTEVLREIAFPPSAFPELPEGTEAQYAWDSYNVTEDADLAGALAVHGYSVKVIDSTTFEEATVKLSHADRQRQRWLKGYAQTGLVYARRPLHTARQMGPLRWFCFNLLMLGTPFNLLVNPIYWGLTITYLVSSLAGYEDGRAAIDHLFPAPVFYTGVVLMVVGNLLLFWQLIQACLYRDGYSSVKYMLLVPLWWAFTSWSAYRTLPELVLPALRYRWNKTEHGHDMHKEGEVLGTGQMTKSLDTI